MKIRQGFVSNSSSSSFVVLGYAVPKGSITKEDAAKKLGLITEEEIAKSKYPEDDIHESFYKKGAPWFKDCSDDYSPEYKTLIGIKIADISSEDGLAEQEVDFDDIVQKAKHLQTTLEIDPNIPLKLYTGTRDC